MEAVAGAETILDRAWVGPGSIVLDIGRGPGRVTRRAMRRVGDGGHVIALDIQAGKPANVRGRIDRAPNVSPVRASAQLIPLAESSVDRAILVTVLGEIPRREEALLEIRRVLLPSAVVASYSSRSSDTGLRAECRARRSLAAQSAGSRHTKSSTLARSRRSVAWRHRRLA